MARSIPFGFNIRAQEAVDSRIVFDGRPWTNPEMIFVYRGLLAVDTGEAASEDSTLWILTNEGAPTVEASWTQFEGGGGRGVQVYADNTAYEVGDLVRVGTDQIYMVRVAVADTNTCLLYTSPSPRD